MSAIVIKLTAKPGIAGRTVTRHAAIAIQTRTADWTIKCRIGVAVRSRTIEADIMIVKITPTMEFSGPKTN